MTSAARFSRLYANELKLQHPSTPRIFSSVCSTSMPHVIVHQNHRACRLLTCVFLASPSQHSVINITILDDICIELALGSIVLTARNKHSWSHSRGSVLRKIQHHKPERHMVTMLLETKICITMQLLSLLSRCNEMCMTVGMHDIPRLQNRLQAPRDL